MGVPAKKLIACSTCVTRDLYRTGQDYICPNAIAEAEKDDVLMKMLRSFHAMFCFTALAAGCAGVVPLTTGASQTEVRAAWGTPTGQTKTAAGERWTYSGAPEGREVWLVEFDANGRMLSRTQGLTMARVTQIQNGLTQPDVEALIGPSYWTLRYPFKPEELVHVYRFNDIITPTCFYVGYNASGVVTSTGMQEENRGPSNFGMARPC